MAKQTIPIQNSEYIISTLQLGLRGGQRTPPPKPPLGLVRPFAEEFGGVVIALRREFH
jgi:hypothetical protein